MTSRFPITRQALDKQVPIHSPISKVHHVKKKTLYTLYSSVRLLLKYWCGVLKTQAIIQTGKCHNNSDNNHSGNSLDTICMCHIHRALHVPHWEKVNSPEPLLSLIQYHTKPCLSQIPKISFIISSFCLFLFAFLI